MTKRRTDGLGIGRNRSEDSPTDIDGAFAPNTLDGTTVGATPAANTPPMNFFLVISPSLPSLP